MDEFTVSMSDGVLAFSLTGALSSEQAAKLRLHICGETYAFADARYDSGTHTYRWRHADRGSALNAD